MKFSKKNFGPYAENATVKNIITINKYNVGMKSLDPAIIVSVFNFHFLGSGYCSGSGSVSLSGSAPLHGVILKLLTTLKGNDGRLGRLDA